MTEPTFDPNKPVQRRDGQPGWKFELLADDLSGEYAFAFKVTKPNGCVYVERYTKHGYIINVHEGNDDLINIPEPKKLRPWQLSEVPLDGWFRLSNPERNRYWRRLLEFGSDGITIHDLGYHTFTTALKCLEWTRNPLAAYPEILPCGVESD